jgi:hypothetical protein
LLIDDACYEPGSASVQAALAALYGDDSGRHAAGPRVLPPTPLGRIGRAITAERSWEAATRPLSDYEAIVRRTSP